MSVSSPPVRRSRRIIFAAMAVMLSVLVCAAIAVGYLVLVRQYNLHTFRYLFNFRFVQAYLMDARVRELISHATDRHDSEFVFQTVGDTTASLLMSRKLYRPVDMFGQARYMYHPSVRKLGFRVLVHGVGFGIETEDTPRVRDLLQSATVDLLARARYDAHGFRAVGDAEPIDCQTRTLFLGDSFTDGAWVNDDQTFVSHYDRLLRAHGDARACAVNAGVNGYGPLEESFILEHYTSRIARPSHVIVMVFANDVDADYHAVVTGRLKDAAAKWTTGLTYLQRIIRFSREQGASVLLVAIPTKQQVAGAQSREHYQAKLAAFAADEQVRLIDLLDGFTTFDSSALYIAGDPHFSPRGHEVVAGYLIGQAGR